MIAYSQLRATDGSIRGDLVWRAADNAFIPADRSNLDWVAYQAWLAAGNTPSPPPSPDGSN